MVAGLLLARRLDLMALGDDTASVLGVPVRSTRFIGIVLAVVLTAAAVTLAGPIGFVGLCAPVIVRLLGRVVPALNRHAVLIPACGLVGALVVIGADAVVRAMFGAEAGIAIPTGVVTTIAGAVVLVLLARRLRDAGPTRQPPAAGVGLRSRRRFALVLAACAALAAGTLLLGLLAGHTWLRTGDIGLWLSGQGPPLVRFALDERAPRVVAAMVAGAAIALAGTLTQATCRNPLAEPGLLGITAGAGARRGDRGDRRRDGDRRCVEPGHPDGRDDRRAGRLRPGVRADLARRAERRPAGAGRHRRLVRRVRPDHAVAGASQSLGHPADLHLAVRDHLRPHLGAGRAGRHCPGRSPCRWSSRSGGSWTCWPRTMTRRVWSASTWNGCG